MHMANYNQEKVLVIPQGLDGLSDIKLVAKANGCAIYFKHLQDSLLNIEFYTNQPCLLYIEQGEEEFTTWQNKPVFIRAGQFLLLQQGQNLHSDFVKISKNLKAWMIFLSPQMCQQALSYQKSTQDSPRLPHTLAPLEHDLVTEFFKQINAYDQVGLQLSIMLESKVNELALILNHGFGHLLMSWLSNHNPHMPARRNLKRLLANSEILALSVEEIAAISGRSQSGFNREFKRSFGLTPQKWLVSKRLDYAKELIATPNLSITDIATTVGYNNVSHFIKSYKTRFGITPKQDRLDNF